MQEQESLDSAAAEQLVRGNTAFALALAARLVDEPGNLVFSPFSISAALAMTYAGARGQTEHQIAQALRFPLPQEGLHSAFSALLQRLGELTASGQVRLAMANSLWPQQRYGFLTPFLDLCRTCYGVSIRALDFRADPDACRLQINAWAQERTLGRIRDLVSPGMIDPLTRLVLVNAVHFQGAWLTRFDEAHTAPAPFYSRSGSPVPAQLMARRGTFGYAAPDGLQLLELPYAGSDLSMAVLLPLQPVGLPELERAVTPDLLSGWLASVEPREVQVFLPRLRSRASLTLNEDLAALGMPDAFDEDLADFSGIDGQIHWLFLAFAVHQAFVEVNEQGTEAAASTAAVIRERSLPSSVPTFRADHPFLFLVRDRATGTILFLGRLVDPSSPA